MGALFIVATHKNKFIYKMMLQALIDWCYGLENPITINWQSIMMDNESTMRPQDRDIAINRLQIGLSNEELPVHEYLHNINALFSYDADAE
jgi:hypothetical protein